MNKVVNVNLSGNAYHVEEAGFDRLDDYLEDARLRLAGNPDLDEIMADLEQSVAEKMHRFLNSSKTVVTAAEVEQIVAEMGPVNGGSEDASSDNDGTAGTHSSHGSRSTGSGARVNDESGFDAGERKLYKLNGPDEKMLTGVCAGLAAYFGVDVSLVRIIFIALAFASAGLGILFYLVLALIVPAAKTPQQHAAAYGVPFDAREVIDRAKSKFDDFRSGREWRSQQRYLNRHARKAGFDGIGSILALVVVLFAILFGIWLLQSLFIAVGTGPGFGMNFGMGFGPFHYGMPWWAILLLVILAVYVIGWVFGEGRRDDRSAFGSALVTTIKVLLILFVIYVALRILF